MIDIVLIILSVVSIVISTGIFIRGVVLFYQYRKYKRELHGWVKRVLEAGSPELAFQLLETHPTNFGEWLMEIAFRIKNAKN